MFGWIIAAVFGGWGGSWWRFGEGWERNPPWCLPCLVFLGALSAIVINVLIGQELGNLSFFDRALLSFGSGVAGTTLIGGVLDLARGNKAGIRG